MKFNLHLEEEDKGEGRESKENTTCHLKLLMKASNLPTLTHPTPTHSHYKEHKKP